MTHMSFHMEFQTVTLSRLCVSSKVQWPCNTDTSYECDPKRFEISISISIYSLIFIFIDYISWTISQ